MKILGVHTGHCASACLFNEGKVVAEVAEERFTRTKNQSGYPAHAVEWLLERFDKSGGSVDAVAVAGKVASMNELDWHGGSWEGTASRLSRLVPSSVMTSNALVGPYTWVRATMENTQKKMASRLHKYGVRQDQIHFVEHHTCHTHAAYWLDYNRSPGKTLVVTLDNTGDGMCGSVSIAEAGSVERIHGMQSLQSVGMVYTAVTRFLGMKPVEHEYKVMGLAPYAREAYMEKVCEILRQHMDLTDDHLDFVNKTGLGETALVERFQKDLALQRFDNIAGGAQLLIETLVLAYLKAWQQKTGIRKLAVGGGVFMNVKMNKAINELPMFDEVFFLPSCGDEHNAAGAALKVAFDMHNESGKTFDPEPLGPLYLGPEYTNDDIERELAGHADQLRWRKCADLERDTAELLAQGRIVGRMRGRMEFGARSLGNRSIIAAGNSLETVHRINAAIKMRDFWMPFAPSMLNERQGDYVYNPKASRSPYMILAFESTPHAHKALISGLHPQDKSCRPQFVEKDWNPRYHHMLKCYEEMTGEGGILNTSFNLHGDPVVCSPADAIYTYNNSALDYLTVEDFLIWNPERVQADEVNATRVSKTAAESAPVA